jgi:hypothetical protein
LQSGACLVVVRAVLAMADPAVACAAVKCVPLSATGSGVSGSRYTERASSSARADAAAAMAKTNISIIPVLRAMPISVAQSLIGRAADL